MTLRFPLMAVGGSYKGFLLELMDTHGGYLGHRCKRFGQKTFKPMRSMK